MWTGRYLAIEESKGLCIWQRRRGGTKKPTTDKESGELGAEVASASHDVNDSGGANSGTGASVGVGTGAAGMDAMYKISLVSGFAHDAITS